MHCATHHYPMGVDEGRLYSPSTSHHTWQEHIVADRVHAKVKILNLKSIFGAKNGLLAK